ncbi:forkhead-associated domain-containing protein [Tanacetum coccineum]
MNKRSLQSFNSETKKPKLNISITASLHIKCFASKTLVEFIDLEPRRPYTIGRDRGRCDYVFDHPEVSKTHCQLIFDDHTKKVFISDGVRAMVRVSLNDVFVDGVRVGNGESKELRAGSEVSVVCGSCVRVGFLVEKIEFLDKPELESSNSRFPPDKVLSNVGPLNQDTPFSDNKVDLHVMLKQRLLCCSTTTGLRVSPLCSLKGLLKCAIVPSSSFSKPRSMYKFPDNGIDCQRCKYAQPPIVTLRRQNSESCIS